jgi:membrane associated rhomboid family serine protease
LFGHVLFGPGGPPAPLVGASGAICGLTGMYLVLFPRHDVHAAIWFRLAWWLPPWIKTFPLTGIYAVIFFTAFDVLALVLGWGGEVAHGVHMAGFLCGMLIGLVLLVTGLVKSQGYDLLTWIMGNRWRQIWG